MVRQQASVETREVQIDKEKLSHQDTSPARDQEIVEFPYLEVFSIGLSNLL